MAIEGEALLAAIGIDAILKPGSLRITAPQREEAAKWANGALFKRELKRFIAGTDFGDPPDLPEFDYLETLELLATPIDISHLEEKVQGNSDETLPLLMAAGGAREFAFNELPKRSRAGALGPKPVEPDDAAVSRFRRIWSVLQRPMVLFEELEAGTLTSAHVRAFGAAFPELTELLRQALFEALVDFKATHPARTELPRKREAVIAILLGSKTWTPELFAEMQANLASPEAGQQPGKGKLDMNFDSVATNTQKIALK